MDLLAVGSTPSVVLGCNPPFVGLPDPIWLVGLRLDQATFVMKLNSKLSLVASSLVLLAAVLAPAGLLGEVGPNPIIIDARTKSPQPAPLPFPVGGKSPNGHVLSANSSYLTLDGKPWFPLMGEFHYSRYPEADWEEEIRPSTETRAFHPA